MRKNINSVKIRKKMLLILFFLCTVIAAIHAIFAKHGFRQSIHLNKKLIHVIEKQDRINKKIQSRKILIQLMNEENKDLIEERIIKVLKYSTGYITLILK